MNTLTRQDIDNWVKYLTNKPCPIHPNKTIKNGKWGLWCGEKDEFGRWCDGGSINLDLIRKEQNVKTIQRLAI